MEGKIFHLRLAEKNEFKYMASLQLNGHHVCSSALFKKGFPLTAGECLRHIAQRIKQEKQKNTAVLGDRDLKAGQRVNVLKLAHIDRVATYQADIGMVMVGQSKRLIL